MIPYSDYSTWFTVDPSSEALCTKNLMYSIVEKDTNGNFVPLVRDDENYAVAQLTGVKEGPIEISFKKD